jgi:leucyl/phenylalanyl-tRNA--protein transferase
LVGGLYGIALGRVFFGESMFTHETDASKVALAGLIRILDRLAVPLVDCQQETAHLASFGARPISRRVFATHLAELIPSPGPPQGWPRGMLIES